MHCPIGDCNAICRKGRFRDSDVLRHVFETVVAQCLEAGLASGQRYAADAGIIAADANRQKSSAKATQKGRNVVRPSKTYSRLRSASITGAMWRS